MNNQTLVGILKSQYKASLRMLRTVIEKTPDEELYASEYSNPSWQIAYHAIWGTQFYLGANAESFIPWEEAIEGAESCEMLLKNCHSMNPPALIDILFQDSNCT